MCHHKAPHRRVDARREAPQACSTNEQIPEPATLRDDYAGRTDAIREQQQAVFRDLTRLRSEAHAAARAVRPRSCSSGWASSRRKSRSRWTACRKKLTGKELKNWKYQRYMQDYLACVQSVDDNVGRLLDWLDANGLAENTVVIYTSDQGFFLGDHGMYDKRFMYEESLRMPFLVRWPGGHQAGQRVGRDRRSTATSRRRSWSWPG